MKQVIAVCAFAIWVPPLAAQVWSAGPALGTANSILAAGNLTYTFNDAVTLGGGVLALPSTRSMDGQFPWWDRVDARHRLGVRDQRRAFLLTCDGFTL